MTLSSDLRYAVNRQYTSAREATQQQDNSNKDKQERLVVLEVETTSRPAAVGAHSNNVIVNRGDLSLIDLLANPLLVSYNLINTKFDLTCNTYGCLLVSNTKFSICPQLQKSVL